MVNNLLHSSLVWTNGQKLNWEQAYGHTSSPNSKNPTVVTFHSSSYKMTSLSSHCHKPFQFISEFLWIQFSLSF